MVLKVYSIYSKSIYIFYIHQLHTYTHLHITIIITTI